MQKTIVMNKAQIVNGGHTIRALSRMAKGSKLKSDVRVPVRAITSQGDKEFGSNVAVNQNNQNQVSPEFLRSNDPSVIQLGHALMSLGWFLERRSDELSTMSDEEREAIRIRLGHPLEGRVIPLKAGMQAFVATFFELPDLAKKDPKRIFLGPQSNGYFDAIFSATNGKKLTAEKFIVAYKIQSIINEFVAEFIARKRRKARVNDWASHYAEFLGETIVRKHSQILDQVIPQSAVFLAGTLYQDVVKTLGYKGNQLVAELEASKDLIITHLNLVLQFAKEHPGHANNSWPTLLKNGSFFKLFLVYLKGRPRKARRPSTIPMPDGTKRRE